MGNLLDKFNVLVRSSLNNFLTDAGTPRVPPERLGKDIDKEVAALRQRIDEALSEEDAMHIRLDQMEQQIIQLDQQADDLVQRGDEANARLLIQQMQRQQRQAAMLKADLEEHKHATSAFIERVNMLDAIVSDARREQEQGQEQAPLPDADPEISERAPGVVLSNLLREARERVENALSPESTAEGQAPSIKINITNEDAPKSESAVPAATPAAVPPTQIKINTDLTPAVATPATTPPTDQGPAVKINIKQSEPPAKSNDPDVDDDLAKRRSRLSKPD